jgi:general bacterial porin, GBP family
MKKSLIALAALATVATAAQAQSSVTIYGIVDMGIMSSKTDGSAGNTLAAQSGALSTSRLGFRGVEDLGGGLKANFVLETEINADVGTNGGTVVSGAGTGKTSTTGVMFNRAANISLESAQYGSIQLGRMNKLEYDAVIANDAFGAANFGGAVRVGYITSGIYRDDARFPNAVVLRAPALGGLKLAYQRQLGEQAGDSSAHSSDSLMADFTYGKLRVLATWAENKTAAGAKFDEVTTLGANYDFGVAHAFVGHMERKIEGGSAKPKSDYLGVKVPVNAKVNVMAQYTKISDQSGTAGNDADVYAVGATYAFSKRTTAYAMYGQSSNDGLATAYVTNLGQAVTDGKNQKATTVGIRHTF